MPSKKYAAGPKDQEKIDDTFNKLRQQGKMQWAAHASRFLLKAFVVWKTVEIEGKRVLKGRAVIDSREFNDWLVKDSYPLPEQSEIHHSRGRNCAHLPIPSSP
ncbi:hypothetical protein P154DRAFT_606362 [Amniculicola lignicola CBS 123094]|uniref:Uncharacterized protein n=1 Tax=Amniculicola lignicola CBS 123094 TaxID=1392246 RepID=A0A6A5WWD0_9PLEO|nr:hypothetical protein P154DRAFT_606362 [Amniculicola lignicola CBS 123094]